MPHDPIRDAQEAIIRGGEALFGTLPVIIKNIILKELWKTKATKAGEAFGSFREFVEDKGFWGLDTRYDDLVLFCKKDAECVAMLEAERGELAKHGGAREQGCNTTLNPPRGTADYTKRRLKRDRPDLYDRVIAGELSANAAAIEAGFRKKDREVPFQDLAERLAEKHDTDYLIGLIDCLVRHLPEKVDISGLLLANATPTEIRRALRKAG